MASKKIVYSCKHKKSCNSKLSYSQLDFKLLIAKFYVSFKVSGKN
jgi:hypothetical protein